MATYDDENVTAQRTSASAGDNPEVLGLTDHVDSEPQAVVKADLLGGKDAKAHQLLSFLTAHDANMPSGALPPPYDFTKMYQIFEYSSILRPNIDAYVTNIDSFGHHFTPAIDLTSREADRLIEDAIEYEQMLAVREGKLTLDQVQDPQEEQIQSRKKRLAKLARLEFVRLRAFFNFACPDISFTELRRRTRQDVEALGNAFWEVIRNALGEIVHLHYAAPINMRLLPADTFPTPVAERVKVTDITWTSVTRQRFFRRYMLLDRKNGLQTYFKEFGDPRTVSRKTGAYYKDEEALKAAEPNSQPASEILHFKIFTPTSPYGIPRWVSNLPATMGSRELDEVNLNYFHNNVVPPLALLCSGGRLGKGVAEKIEEFIDEHLKGKKGINRILVLEAEGQKAAGEPGPRAIPKIQFVPLRDVQQTDALFQQYDVRNEEKVAKSFRLPRILRGDDSGLNRATAWASLKFADEQIFEPEREGFDDVMNRKLMVTLGVIFWSFRSNAPVVRDPERMSEMLERLVKAGVLLPREARELAADIFNHAFTDVSEEWTNRPLPYTLALLHTGKHPDPPDQSQSTQSRPDPQPEPLPAQPATPGHEQGAHTQDAQPPPIKRAGQPLNALGVKGMSYDGD